MSKPPQPPKSYRGFKIERFSRSFQVLFRAVKGETRIGPEYSFTELKLKITRLCESQVGPTSAITAPTVTAGPSAE